MCTGISLKSKEGHYFWGRTQEFNLSLQYDGIILPRNYDIKAAMTSYPTKYAVVGVTINELPLVADGLNEKGLMGGSFYFGNYNRYATENEVLAEGKLPLAGAEFVTYALTNYQSVAEIKERANLDTAIAISQSELGMPQHYVFQDASGASIAVEPSIAGGYEIYDNPVGVFTNSPKFDWHLVNLQNYVGLSQEIDPDITMGDLKIFTSGKGSGVRGIPGDYTPQSRFIRAAYLKHLANPVTDAEGIDSIFHILNSFDIPKGVVTVSSAEDIQYTHYTSAYDPQANEMYIHTYGNRMIQTLKLEADFLDSQAPHFFRLENTQQHAPMKKK